MQRTTVYFFVLILLFSFGVTSESFGAEDDFKYTQNKAFVKFGGQYRARYEYNEMKDFMKDTDTDFFSHRARLNFSAGHEEYSDQAGRLDLLPHPGLQCCHVRTIHPQSSGRGTGRAVCDLRAVAVGAAVQHCALAAGGRGSACAGCTRAAQGTDRAALGPRSRLGEGAIGRCADDQCTV